MRCEIGPSLAVFSVGTALTLSLAACSQEKGSDGNAIAESTSGVDNGPSRKVLRSTDRITNRLVDREEEFLKASRRGMETQNTGDPVPASNYRWQVGLRVTPHAGTSWRCGGILLSPQYVLTAAHCVDAFDALDFSRIGMINPATIEVFHGSDYFAGSQALAVDSGWGVRIHTYWKSNSKKPMAYDAALLRLKSPISNSVAAPAQVNTISNGSAVVSGWGAFNVQSVPSNVLRAVAVPIADNNTCRSHLESDDRAMVTETTLCTVSPTEDACSGDSGGPLVVGSRARPQTVGIVSWGPPKRCSALGPMNTLVGGYTKAAVIADWIVEITGDGATVTRAKPEPLFPVKPSIPTTGSKG